MEVGKCAKEACNNVKQTYLLFYCRHLMSVMLYALCLNVTINLYFVFLEKFGSTKNSRFT